MYTSLRGLLSDQLREIGFCRHRLTELTVLLHPHTVAYQAPSHKAAALPADQGLLPADCATLDDAVQQLEKCVSDEDLIEFDRQMQEVVHKQFRALVNVCMATSAVIKTLSPMIQDQAESYLDSRLESANIVDMYLKQFPEGEGQANVLKDNLTAAFDGAAPALARLAADKEISLIAIPAGNVGKPLREPLRECFPHARIVATDLCDEIVFYREDPHVMLADLEQLGPVAQDAYRQRAVRDPGSLHSRIDITDWRSAVLVK
jgi:hypothetical protein